MKYEFEVTETDYVKATSLYHRITPKQVFVWILIAVCVVIVSQVRPGGGTGILVSCLVGGAIGWLVTLLIITPRTARKHYRKYKQIHGKLQAELFDDGLGYEGEDFAAKLYWIEMLKWRQDNEYILMYPMPKIFYVIPKSLEKNGFNIALLEKKLQEHVGNET